MSSLFTFLIALFMPVIVVLGVIVGAVAFLCVFIGVWIYLSVQSARDLIRKVSGGHL